MTKILQNFYKTTVSVAWGTGTGNLYITTKPTSNTAGWLVVSPNSASLREIVAYSGTGTDGTGDYIVCTARGVGGTTAQAHTVAEPVRLNITAEYWADIFVSPTFTGTVTVPTPVGATDAATKDYADGLAIAGSPDSSTTTKGISKMSVAPASAISPIAVGDNDPRVPTTAQVGYIPTSGEKNALVGNNLDIAVGTGNKYVTQTGFQHGAEKYAADAGANDTYVITLSPVPASYATGMVIHFKANTINTGAATLNVNSLGAKTIVKYVSTTLASGDIAAGMYCTVIYDGTNFVLQNPIATIPPAALVFTKGTASKNLADASTTQNIAHGLAATPTSFTVTGVLESCGIAICLSGNSVQYSGIGVPTANSFNLGPSSTQYQAGVITVDATNIIITWTKVGSATGTATLAWEASV